MQPECPRGEPWSLAALRAAEAGRAERGAGEGTQSGEGSRLQLPREGPGQKACWRAAGAVFMLVGIRRRKRRSQSCGSTVPCAPARGVSSVPPAPRFVLSPRLEAARGSGDLFVSAFRGPSPARGPLNALRTRSSGPHPPPQRGALEPTSRPIVGQGLGPPGQEPLGPPPPTAQSLFHPRCVCGGCSALGDLAPPPALTLGRRSPFSKSHLPPPAGPSRLRFTGDQREWGY